MSVLKSWGFWISCAISLLCLWLALRGVPLAELGHAAARAHLGWLSLAIFLQFPGIVTRAWRWVILLYHKGDLTASFWAQCVGYLFTNVFPFRLGEAARVIIMAERCRLPVVQVAASALIERLLDVASIVVFLIVVLPQMKVPPLVTRTGMIFGALTLSAILFCLLSVRFSHASERILRYVFGRIPFLPLEVLLARWRELITGFAPLTRWQIAGQAVVWSLISWALTIGLFWAVIVAFRPDGTVIEATFMVVALAFAVAVPSSPGFIGVFQLVGQQALVLPFGAKYDATDALAITMTAHLIYYLLTTLLGILGLWWLGESSATLKRIIRGEAKSGTG